MTKPRTPALEAEAGSRPSLSDISLVDVARMAGVSPATVSRVLNHPKLVRESKRQAVEDVLARVSYIRNNAARALISRKSLTVGLIVPTLANPLFASGIEAIEQTLQGAGYGLLVACSYRDPDREYEQTKVMLERGVDGMILTGPVHKEELFQLTHSRGVAVSLQDCNADILDRSAVAMRDADATALAIDTLVARGHRDIAILTGPTGNTPPVADRLRGARERMTHHFGRSRDNDVEETPDYDAESSMLAVKRLLDRKSSYTAIALTGDILAIGAVMELRRRGLSVPQDISIIGCGDQVMTQYVDPPLTTVHLPFRQMAERAAERLLEQLAGAPPSGLEYMNFHLVERASIRTL
jgi:LacI family transcriptional regulator